MRRGVRIAVRLVAIAAFVAFALTSCPSHRDGVAGQLASAAGEAESAARSAALALTLWEQGRSTRPLLSVQLTDARDEVAGAADGLAGLRPTGVAELDSQRELWNLMAGLIFDLDTAVAAALELPGQPAPQVLAQRILVAADTLGQSAA
jgi:hypothetical protein